MVKSSGEHNAFGGASIDLDNFAHAVVRTVWEPVLVVTAGLKIVAASEEFYSTFGLHSKEIKGLLLQELDEKYWDLKGLHNLLTTVKKGNSLRDHEFLIDLKNFGEKAFLINAESVDYLSNQGLILISFKPKADTRHQRSKDIYYLKTVRDILSNAPAMICRLKGPEHIFELANEQYLDLIGKRDILGKTVREALPEVENQGFIELLDIVYKSGKPFIGNEISIKLKQPGKPDKNAFLDFVYQPIFEPNGEVSGIFVHAVDVTEKVSVRKKVEQSEQELRNMLETLPAIIWLTDSEGTTKYMNKNWYEYTGQTSGEAEESNWVDAVHPEEREKTNRQFGKAFRERKPYHAIFRLRSRKGDYRWVIGRGSPKFTIEGEFQGMIGTVVDIHEEKLKEQLIRDKENRIRAIVQEATVATAVYTGEEMKIEMANDAMVNLWGKDRSVIGKSLREALPELEGQPFFDLLQKVYNTGETYWGKEDKVDLLINGRMQTGYFNFTYKPLRNEKNEIYGILNMAQDISEMVNSRELLKQSESHFRQMANLMPEKVTNTDAEGNLIYFNQNWLDYTGIEREELVLRGWSHLIHEDDFRKFEKKWRKSLKTGKNFEMEIRILGREGKYKWHLSRAEAVKDDDGRIKMWISTNTEIHRLKEEEKRKEDFLKMVSHELKTPVTSIKGYVQLLLTLLRRSNGADHSKLPLQPSLERIDHQIVRLTRLISEMLDLSRLEENKMVLQKEVFNINDLVTQTVQDISYTNTQHRIDINHEYRCSVFGDKDRLGQVLINFITNAIKYSPESQNIRIQVKKFKEDKVAVCVIDEGIGIDKEDQKKIFKRFYRIGGESEETYAGFGIGLYLANEIIQRHNGVIEVDSQKGKGSEFRFILSVASEDEMITKEL